MEDLALGLMAAGFGGGAFLLALHTKRDSAARAAQRLAYFKHCTQLLDAPQIGWGTAGFPRLGGTYGGIAADVQVMPDTLTVRKLPTLWVMVTLLGPLPVRTTLNIMVRPMGIEPFSKFSTLEHQITPPPGFPPDCACRTDVPEALLPETILRPFAAVFDDQRVKEVVLSPKGLRITFLAEEAHRGRYLIFRDAEMGKTPLAPARLKPILGQLYGLHKHIITASSAMAERNFA